MFTQHYSIHEVAPYINWLYFFHTWGLPARLASISRVHGCVACRENWLNNFPSEERQRAREAVRLFDDAQRMLNRCEEKIRTHARVAILPANSSGDDILVYTNKATEKQDRIGIKERSKKPREQERFGMQEMPDESVIRIPFLRQQSPDQEGHCLCLSDFIRPLGKGEDRIGVFACSTDKTMETEDGVDEYHHLLRQTLADRLAEATAERLHEQVRKQLWGFSPHESLSIEAMLREEYVGKRPAVGYPSIPDQSIVFLIDRLLNLQEIGIHLTESGAMIPHASTCGFILSHPAARHFAVGRIQEDQLCDYMRRRGLDREEMRRFLTLR